MGVLILAMTGDNRTSSTPIPKIPPPRPQPPQNKFFLLLPPESIRRRSLPKGVRISREKSLIKKSISNGKLKRGGAMKHPNTIEVNGHLFVPRAFVTPTYCSHCRQFLFGLSAKTGVRCTECNMVAHTKCFEVIHVCQILSGISREAKLFIIIWYSLSREPYVKNRSNFNVTYTSKQVQFSE